jgi:hypothetical protein
MKIGKYFLGAFKATSIFLLPNFWIGKNPFEASLLEQTHSSFTAVTRIARVFLLQHTKTGIIYLPNDHM